MGKRKIRGLFLAAFLMTLFCGCAPKNLGGDRTNVDFTVVGIEEVPEELIAVVDEKKADAFKVTYKKDGYLYLVRGYGRKPTGGYSIQVDAVSGDEEALYVKTSLVGPEDALAESQSESYPYIILKIESIDKTVMFE